MLPNEVTGRRVLISPLNWGMGHVARCIPLIDLLIRNGNSVFVACDASQENVFRQYFPDLIYLHHEGYPFDFRGDGRFEADLLRQFSLLKSRLKQEKSEVETMVSDLGIEVLISDHRYGFRSSSCYSILLTHQLNLPVRWYEGWVQNWHHRLLRKFDLIWVPDTEDSLLSGKLSHNKKQFNVRYIGWLSRFSLYPANPEKNLDQVAVISGPEVYGKQFLQQLIAAETDTTIIAPPVLCNEFRTESRLLSSADWKVCDQLMLKAKKIISRSGYSTMMDIKYLGTDCELNPTPGQREQEYLAQIYMSEKKINP